MELSRFIESTLRRVDGLTEAREADLVDALLPPHIAAALGLSEQARLRLRGATGPGEAHAGYGSGVLSQICSLAEGVGRRYRVELDGALPKRERVDREAGAALCFRNAVGRVESIEETVLEYLLFDFRYAALSEERHEGLVTVAIHVGGGSSPGLAGSLHGYLSEHPEARRPWSGQGDPLTDPEPGSRAARALALARAMAESTPFIGRLERRLQRDVRRTEDYYEALRREVETRKGRGRETPGLSKEKLDAVEAERSRRHQDLRRRYAVILRLEPLGVLAVRVRGLLLTSRLLRRKRERRASLAWNPIARQLDRWLCEACGAEAVAPALCDGLHLLCPGCPADCPGCGRPGCGACRSLPCPCGWRRDRPADGR